MKNTPKMLILSAALFVTALLHCSDKEAKAIAATEAKLKKNRADYDLKFKALEKERKEIWDELSKAQMIKNRELDNVTNLPKKSNDEISDILFQINDLNKSLVQMFEERLAITKPLRDIPKRIVEGVEGKNLPQSYIEKWKERVSEWDVVIKQNEALIEKTKQSVHTEEELQRQIDIYQAMRDELLAMQPQAQEIQPQQEAAAQEEIVFEKERGIYEED